MADHLNASTTQIQDLERTRPSTSTTNDQGTLGSNLEPANTIVSAAADTPMVSRFASPMPVIRPWMRPRTSRGPTWMPSRLGNSPNTTSKVRPNTNPVMIGLDRNSATQPTRMWAAKIRTPPAQIAAAVVKAMAWATSVGPSAATNEPDITETVETGPRINCFELPKTAYAISAIGTA